MANKPLGGVFLEPENPNFDPVTGGDVRLAPPTKRQRKTADQTRKAMIMNAYDVVITDMKAQHRELEVARAAALDARKAAGAGERYDARRAYDDIAYKETMCGSAVRQLVLRRDALNDQS